MRREGMAPVLLAGVLAVLAGCNTVQPEKEEAPSPAASRHQRLGGTPWMQDLDTRPGPFPIADSNSVTLANGVSLFAGEDVLHGSELWASDGTEAGTWLVKELSPGMGDGPYDLTDVQGTVYFMTRDDYGLAGSSLWKTDGTTAGTVVVKHFPRGEDIERDVVNSLTVVQGTVYFLYLNQLWKSDGTQAGTTLFRQLAPDYNQTDVRLSSALGLLFFEFNSVEHRRELWRTDGTAAGTMLLKDIRSSVDWWQPSTPIATMADAVYFVAGEEPRQLWKTDGTPAGTVLVAELANGISELSVAGNTLFIATNSALWKSDGTEAGTQQVHGFSGSSWYSYTRQLTPLNGTMYFTVRDSASGFELWRSDGTTTGTYQVVDLLPGPESSNPHRLRVWKNHLYFVANADASTFGLWKSDGTAANTTVLATWSASPALINCGFTCAKANLLPLANVLLVQPFDQDDETWRTDGTVAGTWRLGSVQASTRSS
ncbi:MAG TPA: hypothetical protein VEY88_04245, partial [Archangium sp.]|nr:hypothetical protein [Archangium sp.]